MPMDPMVELSQLAVCERVGATPFPALSGLKVGIARSTLGDQLPLNGLRHPPVGDSTGWYLWAGRDLSSDPNFIEPLHVEHLVELCPLALLYLQLPPGWRFLVAPDVEDIWFDEALLEA